MEFCQPGTLTWDLLSRGFIGGQSHRHGAPSLLNLSSSQLLWILLGAKPPPWLTVSMNYLVYFKAPSTQRHSYKAGYSNSLEVICQELVKGQTYLWNVQDLNKPDLLSQSFTTHVKTILSSRSMDWIWRETLVLRSYKSHFPPIISNTAVRSIPVHVLLYTYTIYCENNDTHHPSEIKIRNRKYIQYVILFRSIYNANH